MTTDEPKPLAIVRFTTPEAERREFQKRFILQVLLQCITFTGAILTYHHVALPGLLKESYQNGQAAGWSNAVEQTCPQVKDKIGG